MEVITSVGTQVKEHHVQILACEKMLPSSESQSQQVDANREHKGSHVNKRQTIFFFFF